MSVQSWTSPWQTWVLLFQQGGTAWCETSQWPFSGSQFLHLVFFIKLKGESKVFWLAFSKCQKVVVASTLPTIIPSHLKEWKKPTLGQVDAWVRQIYFQRLNDSMSGFSVFLPLLLCWHHLLLPEMSLTWKEETWPWAAPKSLLRESFLMREAKLSHHVHLEKSLWRSWLACWSVQPTLAPTLHPTYCCDCLPQREPLGCKGSPKEQVGSDIPKRVNVEDPIVLWKVVTKLGMSWWPL